MKSFLWRVAGAAALLTSVLAFPTAGGAVDFQLNVPNGGSGIICSPSCGTVSVTQVGTNELDFTVTLASGNLFRSGANGGTNAAFWLNVSGFTGTLTADTITANWTFQNPATGNPVDGFGNFLQDFALTLPGGQNFDGSTLSFDLHATTLTLANLITSTAQGTGLPTNFLFAADIGNQCTGTGAGASCVTTGFVTTPGPVLGAGLPGVVLACAGLLGLARRRRKIA